ncbi:MAG: AzlC family ABC transporter permease [Lachnospiraceae bacterium]|jgi:4-azaleucine resistance transporter AzlC|nr:AzlC family ABC transporter permease [Lachnospiraceae bacterium]
MSERIKKSFRYAAPLTVPVMVGYLFCGAAFGVLMKTSGFGLGWILSMSVIVFAGSLQFVGVTLLAGAVNPLYALFMAVMINVRHVFYGISMLTRYRRFRRFRPYLIFTLSDETFSVLCNMEVPDGVDEELACLWVSALDQLYWVVGSVAGALLGGAIRFPTKGLDFSLTALFVVIFVEQWMGPPKHAGVSDGLSKPEQAPGGVWEAGQKTGGATSGVGCLRRCLRALCGGWFAHENRIAALLGIASSVAAVALFGKAYFIFPAMVLISVCLAGLYRGRRA